jgi:hypothetical protein
VGREEGRLEALDELEAAADCEDLLLLAAAFSSSDKALSVPPLLDADGGTVESAAA